MSKNYRFTFPNIVGFLLSFLMIGIVQALYGPLLGSFIRDLSINYTQAGLLLGVHFTGALIGVLAFAPLEVVGVNSRLLVWGSLVLMFTGSLIVGLGSSYIVTIAGAFICGLGFGGIDYGLNYIFANAFSARHTTAMLNLLNACFGVGAVAGPGIARIVNYNITIAFVVFSVGCALCLLLLLSLQPIGATNSNASIDSEHSTGRVSVKSVTGIAVVSLFLIVYIFHVGIETGIGGWGQTYLESHNFPISVSTNFVIFFWLAMTASRFLVVPIARLLSGQVIVGLSIIGMTASLLMMHITPGIALLGIGFFIGPIFPTCIPWLNSSVSAGRGVLSTVIALSMLGGVLFPPLIGSIISHWGFTSMQILLVSLSACMLLAFFALVKIVMPLITLKANES